MTSAEMAAAGSHVNPKSAAGPTDMPATKSAGVTTEPAATTDVSTTAPETGVASAPGVTTAMLCPKRYG
jgi:hypothetical protein